MDGTCYSNESLAFQHFRAAHRAVVESTLTSLLDGNFILYCAVHF